MTATVSKGTREANPIGIDFSGDGLQAAQVETPDSGARLLGTSAVEADRLDSDEGLRTEIDRLLRQGRFAGRRIATSLPSDGLSIHHIRLPVMSPRALDEAVTRVVAEREEKPLGSLILRHLQIATAGDREDEADHIVFTVQRSVVVRQLRIAERLGLSLVGITAVPLAVGHAFSYLGQRREESQYTFLLVHLEAHRTHLMILHEGDLRFARSIPQGVHDILQAVAERTHRPIETLREEQSFSMRQQQDHLLLNSGLTDVPEAPRHAAALPYDQAGPKLRSYSEEILSCLCYFAGMVDSDGVDKVIFVGSQANDYAFCQILANRLGLPAQIGDPLAGIRVASAGDQPRGGVRRPQPELAVAVGLTRFGALVN